MRNNHNCKKYICCIAAVIFISRILEVFARHALQFFIPSKEKDRRHHGRIGVPPPLRPPRHLFALAKAGAQRVERGELKLEVRQARQRRSLLFSLLPGKVGFEAGGGEGFGCPTGGPRGDSRLPLEKAEAAFGWMP